LKPGPITRRLFFCHSSSPYSSVPLLSGARLTPAFPPFLLIEFAALFRHFSRYRAFPRFLNLPPGLLPFPLRRRAFPFFDELIDLDEWERAKLSGTTPSPPLIHARRACSPIRTTEDLTSSNAAYTRVLPSSFSDHSGCSRDRILVLRSAPAVILYVIFPTANFSTRKPGSTTFLATPRDYHNIFRRRDAPFNPPTYSAADKVAVFPLSSLSWRIFPLPPLSDCLPVQGLFLPLHRDYRLSPPLMLPEVEANIETRNSCICYISRALLFSLPYTKCFFPFPTRLLYRKPFDLRT